ncbi:MAG: methylmalonyl-CoA mutase family protein [Candidatus Aminicenantes bacterium]
MSDHNKKNRVTTSSGIPVKTLYSREDLPDFHPETQLGEPGHFPFTRGVHPGMYRSRLWTMRQYAGFGTARESNQRYRFLLSQGQTGLSVAFDLPTQLGLDSDDPKSAGEVGKVGVAVDSIEDMQVLFDGIPLDRVSVSMTINATAAHILAMYLALAQSRGLSGKDLAGTIQNDLLKEFIARGTYIFPPEASLRIITDIIRFCREHIPRWNTMSISGYHIREAGATAVQELAFTLANAVTYIQTAQQAGLEVDEFAPRLSFFLAAHNHVFEEAAKFRAARRLWARIMRDRFQAQNPKSWKFRFHTQTSGVTLTAQEPENNTIRVAMQALSAVLGGTQSLHTNSRDEALALPSQESVRLALRTQQIIAYESGVPDTADPLGGSYYVERLTNEIEDKVQEYLDKIHDMGGMLKAIETGYIQKEIHESAYTQQRQLENKEKTVVGLNRFSSGDQRIQFEISHPPEELEARQVRRLNKLKRSRSSRDCIRSLNDLEFAIKQEKNMLPCILECVKAKATLGEITQVLKNRFGTFQDSLIF